MVSTTVSRATCSPRTTKQPLVQPGLTNPQGVRDQSHGARCLSVDHDEGARSAGRFDTELESGGQTSVEQGDEHRGKRACRGRGPTTKSTQSPSSPTAASQRVPRNGDAARTAPLGGGPLSRQHHHASMKVSRGVTSDFSLENKDARGNEA